MHKRFSNKIPKYYKVSAPPLAGQKSPAEQRFVGGVFALSVYYIGKAAELLHCLRVSALFALRFFCLVFGNWFGRNIGVRCFFRLRTWPPTRPPALSPTRTRSWSPTSTSVWHWPVGLPRIFRRETTLLHTRTRSAHAFGAKLSSPSIHSPALGCCAFTLEASAASALHCSASTLKASTASTLHCHTSALEISVAFTLHCGASALVASALEASTASAPHCHASALPAPDVLIRTLAERAIWASWPPEPVRPYGFEVCAHSWPASHPASPSLPAAASASALTGKRLTGQNRHSQHNNDRCFDSCLFHFRFLSLIFRFTAFLSPVLGSFYRDSGAGRKKVTPGIKFPPKKISVATYFYIRVQIVV